MIRAPCHRGWIAEQRPASIIAHGANASATNGSRAGEIIRPIRANIARATYNGSNERGIAKRGHAGTIGPTVATLFDYYNLFCR